MVFGKGYKSGVPLLYLVRGLLVVDPIGIALMRCI